VFYSYNNSSSKIEVVLLHLDFENRNSVYKYAFFKNKKLSLYVGFIHFFLIFKISTSSIILKRNAKTYFINNKCFSSYFSHSFLF